MLKTVYFDAHHRHKWQCFRIRLVDKSKIVNYINTHVLTCNKCVLLSMPHGFGKTTVTYTLAVYYQNKVDTKEIFSKLKISTIPNFDEYDYHLSQNIENPQLFSDYAAVLRIF